MNTSHLIHPTAIIDPSAVLADDVQVGPYSIIGKNVTIGEGTKIHSHVVIVENTRIGRNNEIFQFCSIGEKCQDLKYNDEETWLEIGDNNTIREHCTLHRGTVQDNGVTKIGNHNLFMANTHIAHDCVIGNYNIMANNTGLAGHVQVGDYVVIGGNVGVHQYCHIGSYSMLGGGSTIVKDVPAFVVTSGPHAQAYGINAKGLSRKKWKAETIRNLKRLYGVLYFSDFKRIDNVRNYIATQILPTFAEAQIFLDSIKGSGRGFIEASETHAEKHRKDIQGQIAEQNATK